MTCPLTLTVIVLGPSAADSNVCTATALPINLSNLQRRPFPLWRLTQSRRIALERRSRAQTHDLPHAGADLAPTATSTQFWPLSP
jgi:hypothetical protein